MGRSSMGNGRPPSFSAGRLSRKPSGRSHTSYHNEVTAKTHGGKGYCDMEHKWKVCDWPECESHGKEKKGTCGFIHGYRPETEKENDGQNKPDCQGMPCSVTKCEEYDEEMGGCIY